MKMAGINVFFRVLGVLHISDEGIAEESAITVFRNELTFSEEHLSYDMDRTPVRSGIRLSIAWIRGLT